MPKCEILNHATSQIEIGIDFGGTNIYDVGGTLVYAPSGGTSISYVGDTATLNPLGLDSLNCLDDAYEIVSHQDIGTCNWRITVKNLLTDVTIAGVYPFNLDGKVYQLECGGNEWVMASCGGYEIVDELGVGGLCYTLSGTGEEIIVYSSYVAEIVSGSMYMESYYHYDGSTFSVTPIGFDIYPNMSGNLIGNAMSSVSSSVITKKYINYGDTDQIPNDEYISMTHDFPLQDTLALGTSENLIGQYTAIVDNGLHYMFDNEITWNEAENPDALFPDLDTIITVDHSNDFNLNFQVTIVINVYGVSNVG
jgi:hypothetical protein